jgi:hypothetical protein
MIHQHSHVAWVFSRNFIPASAESFIPITDRVLTLAQLHFPRCILTYVIDWFSSR